MKPSLQTTEWISRYYAALDANEVDESLTYFGPESVMRFNSEAPLVGPKAIGAKTRQVLGLIDHLSHDFPNVWEPEPGLIVMEGEITYFRKDGLGVPVRGSSISRVEANRWLEQRIYVDLSPVFN